MSLGKRKMSEPFYFHADDFKLRPVAVCWKYITCIDSLCAFAFCRFRSIEIVSAIGRQGLVDWSRVESNWIDFVGFGRLKFFQLTTCCFTIADQMHACATHFYCGARSLTVWNIHSYTISDHILFKILFSVYIYEIGRRV